MTTFNTRSYLRLVLFDIDGTLLTTNGIAKHTFAEALEAVLGKPTIAREHDFAGKTDQQIYREIMQQSGFDDETTDARMHEVLDTFLDLLEQRLTPDTVTALPGVHALLEALAGETTVTLGLLTGSMIRGARIKLVPAGLEKYFSFGAFGSDGLHRHELPSIAVERAYNRTGYVFREKEIIIIGDTPNDIHCGSHLNVRTIAVASGGATRDKLAKHDPDFLFDSLENTDEVVEAIIA
jgi:phosphoglycolate phosphatase-like HAD superfamily hydrolase